jgi:nitroimidazol reductase NimA-like FMN-containing flavoprotein (pyridoxamine 5'-phosphate oxidase superfamily)
MWIDRKGSTVLPAPECMRLLAVAAKDTGLGRIGVPTDQAPVIVPVNFGIRDHHIVIRVGPGFFSRAAKGQLVAFEVDHVDVQEGVAWSVLARGLATLIESPTEEEVDIVARPLVPEPGHMILTIRPDVLTGRRFGLHRAT